MKFEESNSNLLHKRVIVLSTPYPQITGIVMAVSTDSVAIFTDEELYSGNHICEDKYKCFHKMECEVIDEI